MIKRCSICFSSCNDGCLLAMINLKIISCHLKNGEKVYGAKIYLSKLEEWLMGLGWKDGGGKRKREERVTENRTA